MTKLPTAVAGRVRIVITTRDLSQIGVVSQRFYDRFQSLLGDVPAGYEITVDIGLLPHVEAQLVTTLASCDDRRIVVESADWRMAERYVVAIRDQREGTGW